uniref:Uncharacterized protein n=1 Tax=Trichuris muris TaxID=70415 RepID=A0A5S6R249_TRIMR
MTSETIKKKTSIMDICVILSVFILVILVKLSTEETMACPKHGECTIEIDKNTCLFMSLKPQMLFDNSVCAEVPNGTLHAFMLPADATYYFHPPTLFYPHPGYCSYFERARRRKFVTLKYRNAWLIVGVQTVTRSSNEEIIRLDLQHAVTKEEKFIRYRKTETTFEPIGNYTVIANYTVMKEVYARNPSKENPLAILVYLWDNIEPQHEWQHVRTFKELAATDEDDRKSFTRSRATCVFPSLRVLCKSFDEILGDCKCPSGYFGKFCHVDINECVDLTPCIHGLCKNTRGSYYCICNRGWQGIHCEEDINECNFPNICGSQGTCENLEGDFRCHCAAGLTGKHCNADVEECLHQPNPCEPGGKCIDTFGSFMCVCSPGWTGLLCNEDVNECVSADKATLCLNGGTCVNVKGSYKCECDKKWTGAKCGEPVDLCEQLNCGNGLCVAKKNRNEVECQCYPGWTGEKCTIDRDECIENEKLCLNNGICVDKKGNYSCMCAPGYTGKDCGIDINECKNIECVNGYCVDVVNDCKCKCYHGWTGTNCTSKLDPCDSPSFDCNRGLCVHDGDLPSCICPRTHTGTFCEIPVSFCETAPCKNGGSCVYRPQFLDFECLCDRHFSGLDCSFVDSSCESSRCKNGGTCIVDYTSGLGYLCSCAKGFHGALCELSDSLVLMSSALPARENAVELTIALILVLAFNSEAAWSHFFAEASLLSSVHFCEMIVTTASPTTKNSVWDINVLLAAFIAVNLLKVSTAETMACPHYGQCTIEIDKNTCLFMSLKPQMLFDNSVCAELPNGTLHAFMLPAGATYYFHPPTLFYPHPGYCSYFERAKGRLFNTHKYRNAWLIVGVQTESRSPNEEIIRLDLQHAVTKEEQFIRYRKNETTLQPIGNYTVIANSTVLKEVYARNPSKENPLAILVYLWDNMEPQHEWQHVRTFKELAEADEKHKRTYFIVNRATCVFPSLRVLCKSFNETTGNCACPSGFTGTFCNKDINECIQSPCIHGLCKNTRGSYYCICNRGWQGTHCEEDINECNFPNTCGSKGTCKNLEGGYRCHCAAGITGKHCDADVEECLHQPNPCEPGGKCIDTFGSFKCVCSPGWTGLLCNEDVNECVSADRATLCLNGGTCVNIKGSYKCECDKKWTGPKCGEPVHLCKRLNCQNGICVTKQMVNEVECKCFKGWAGERCNTDVDECIGNEKYCLNNGICVDPKGNYSCLCAPGYTGNDCGIDINDCANTDCGNGYCVDLVNRYKCHCYSGWTGANCTKKISPCDYFSHNCGKGTCLEDGDLPSCACPPTQTGTFCEINISMCERAPCSNHGICVDDPQGNYFECICEKHFGGSDCSAEASLLSSVHFCEMIVTTASPTTKNSVWDINVLLAAFIAVNLLKVSTAETMACPHYGQCTIEIDKNTCLFMSLKPQMLFDNSVCAELPNGTLHAFMLPAGATYYFHPPTLFYPHPGYCSYFERAKHRLFNTHKYRNAWLIVGVQTESRSPNEEIIRLDLQHAVTKEEQFIRYRKNETTLQPIGNYTVIANSTVLKEVYARNPSKENPLAILVYLWDNMEPQHEWQHVRTFKELAEADEKHKMSYFIVNRATCVFPSLRVLCKSFNETTGNCACPSGFTGTFCNKDINECIQSPCIHGLCKNTRGSYYCICNRGWQGTHCEEDINECNFPNTCGSKGTCKNLEGGYRCHCAAGITGKHCDADVEECLHQPNPCEPGGKCIDTFGSFKCVCSPGWTGLLCNEDVNECVSADRASLCLNGGTCVNIKGSYKCECDKKWTGPKCGEPVHLCKRLNCQNGICVTKQMVNEVECKCFKGWAGERCNTDVDECIGNEKYCLNNGICVDPKGNYSCLCAPGYTGNDCGIDINDCANTDCGNGYCVDLVNRYKCHCYSGWTGANCTKKISPCDYFSHNCGKGTCLEDGDLPSCACPPTQTGTFCEINISMCERAPCSNHGICVDDPQGNYFECICEKHFGGSDCSAVGSSCESSRCRNGGTCIVKYTSGLGYLCSCAKGFHGALCELSDSLVLMSSALPARENAVELTIALILVLAFNSEAAWSHFFAEASLLSSVHFCEMIVTTASPTTKNYVWDTSVHLAAFIAINLLKVSTAETMACPHYGECTIEIDKNTCLFMSLKAQMLFDNSLCAEVPNGTLHAFMLPAGATYYFHPPTLFYPHPGYCPYFERARRRKFVTNIYRNAWLIVGVQTVTRSSNEEIIRLDLQHAVTKEEKFIRYRKTETTFEPIGNYTVIANYTVLKEVYARNPSKKNPLAILVYLWDNMEPKHEWQHVRTFKELAVTDENGARGYFRINRATCVFPSLRVLCKSFNETTGNCTCPSGFTGTFCNKDINECMQSPCIHGLCKNTRGSYYCICNRGWQGTHCEEDINECNFPNTCGSKGTCKNLEGGYRCHCAAGITGKHCDADVQECLDQPNPCEPGGKCIDTFGSFICVCSPGWTGLLCNEDVNECVSADRATLCLNGGTCVNIKGSYKCECDKKWTGPKCIEPVELCKLLNCGNGICVAKQMVNEVECKCFKGWAGERCNTDVDECIGTEKYCLNNGICVDPKGNYSCVCAPGYTGKDCGIDINDCANTDCGNGYCVDLVNRNKCHCYSGWTGASCTKKISPCDYFSHNCGKGTCLEDGDLPSCACPPTQTGTFCEIKISMCERAPCRNDGLCVDDPQVTYFECICDKHFSGSDCSAVDSPCASSRCKNGGTCIVDYTSGLGYLCSCGKGFYGALCELSDGLVLMSSALRARENAVQLTITLVLVLAFNSEAVCVNWVSSFIKPLVDLTVKTDKIL